MKQESALRYVLTSSPLQAGEGRWGCVSWKGLGSRAEGVQQTLSISYGKLGDFTPGIFLDSKDIIECSVLEKKKKDSDQ